MSASNRWQAAARQFSRYVVVGVVSAAIDVGCLWWLLRIGSPTTFALTAAMAAGMLANFCLHRIYTFASRSPFRWSSVLGYLSVVGFNYALTLGVVELGARIGVDTLPAKIVSLPIVAVCGYFLTRRFVFA